MEKYYKRSTTAIVGGGHLNPDRTSYLTADLWKLAQEAMAEGLKDRIFSLELEIMKKGQELDFLKDLDAHPEKYLNKEEING
ncbi:hypothetical protein ES705_33860 [subsurface metagenome]